MHEISPKSSNTLSEFEVKQVRRLLGVLQNLVVSGPSMDNNEGVLDQTLRVLTEIQDRNFRSPEMNLDDESHLYCMLLATIYMEIMSERRSIVSAHQAFARLLQIRDALKYHESAEIEIRESIPSSTGHGDEIQRRGMIVTELHAGFFVPKVECEPWVQVGDGENYFEGSMVDFAQTVVMSK